MCEGGSETVELRMSSVAMLRQRGLELYVITKTHGCKKASGDRGSDRGNRRANDSIRNSDTPTAGHRSMLRPRQLQDWRSALQTTAARSTVSKISTCSSDIPGGKMPEGSQGIVV